MMVLLSKPCKKSMLEHFQILSQIGFLIPNQFASKAKIRGFIFKISGQGVTDAPDQTKHVTLWTYWLLGLYKIGKKVLIKSESRGAIDQKVARSGTFPGNTSLKIRSTCAVLTLVIIENHHQKKSDVFLQISYFLWIHSQLLVRVLFEGVNH